MDKLQAHYRQIADEEYPECEGCKKLRAALLCDNPMCVKGQITVRQEGSWPVLEPCPTCGELRKELREGE